MKKKRPSLFCLSVYVSFFFFYLSATALCQDDHADMIKKITNRQWTLSGTKRTLGVVKCENGELLTFYKSNKVKHTYCKGGEWKPQTESWSLLKVADKWQINISRETYQLVLNRDGKKDRLILRTMNPGKKAVTTDRIFSSEIN